MKFNLLSIIILAISLFSLPAYSQKDAAAADTLGLPGDNLDLFAVLDLFQKSKTIEDFEKELNLEKNGINNLDLNLDKKVDFIKVDTKQKDDDLRSVAKLIFEMIEVRPSARPQSMDEVGKKLQGANAASTFLSRVFRTIAKPFASEPPRLGT